MSFPAYPEYKESGVEWLGEVPEHWALHKLKYIARFSGGGTPSRENLAYWNGDIPWVSPKDMKVEIIVGAEENITIEGLQNSTTSLVSPGGILIVVRSGILKHTIPVAINNVEVALNQDMKALRFNPKLALFDFFFRWIQGFNNELLHAWLKQGATVESVEQEYLADTIVPMPCVYEQRMIVGFLDHETARIDALIEEQQRLIELLKEKRQAVISHAVTKGLDPTVPMKDSGVEWLGEVPAHWDVLNFNLLVYIAEGQVNPRVQPYSEMLLIAPNHVESGTGRLIHTETAEEQGADSGKYVCQKGDVIYSKIRPALRKVCLAPEACLCSADMYPMRGVSGLDNEYLFWFILSEPFSAFALLESDRVAMPKINRESLGGLKLARPPLEEQKAISEFLVRETLRIDALIDEANSGVGLLNERRSALISAAVTGKIDVRGWLPPASTQAPELAVVEAN